MKLQFLSAAYLAAVFCFAMQPVGAHACDDVWALEQRELHLETIRYSVRSALSSASRAMSNVEDMSTALEDGQIALETLFRRECGVWKHDPVLPEHDWWAMASCPGTTTTGVYFSHITDLDMNAIPAVADFDPPNILRLFSSVQPGMPIQDIVVTVSCPNFDRHNGIRCRSCFGGVCETGTVVEGICMLDRYTDGGSTGTTSDAGSGQDSPYNTSGDQYGESDSGQSVYQEYTDNYADNQPGDSDADYAEYMDMS